MNTIEIMLVGLGLAMDAFAVAICKGLSMKKMEWNKAVIIAIYFGLFQAVMPIIGYIIGATFRNLIESVDHWIAFILLGIIGINMVKESFDNEEERKNDRIDIKTMILLSIATSIDALVVGITFAFFKNNIVKSVTIIGFITLILSLIGVKIGNKFGDKFQNKAELTGGIILIIIGTKILLEHLGIIRL